MRIHPARPRLAHAVRPVLPRCRVSRAAIGQQAHAARHRAEVVGPVAGPSPEQKLAGGKLGLPHADRVAFVVHAASPPAGGKAFAAWPESMPSGHAPWAGGRYRIASAFPGDPTPPRRCSGAAVKKPV